MSSDAGADVREVRRHMTAAADVLKAAQGSAVTCDRSHTPISYQLPGDVLTAMAYAESMLRTLAATILPPDAPARRPMPRRRDPATGRYTPAGLDR